MAKNFQNEKKYSVITDMDINAITVGVPEQRYLPSQTEMIQERQDYLSKRLETSNGDYEENDIFLM